MHDMNVQMNLFQPKRKRKEKNTNKERNRDTMSKFVQNEMK